MNDYISPFKCEVRQTAGYPFYPSGKKHSGVDYVPIDKTIEKNWFLYAVCDGVVTFRSTNTYGHHVILKSDDGIYFLYAHLDCFSQELRTGMYVRQGQYLGVAGNTGNSTGRHLHFEAFRGYLLNKLLLNPDDIIPFTKECDVELWQNGSTVERLYMCAEHAYNQYDDVAHFTLPPRQTGTNICTIPIKDSEVYMIQVSLGTGTCVGFVKYKGRSV